MPCALGVRGGKQWIGVFCSQVSEVVQWSGVFCTFECVRFQIFSTRLVEKSGVRYAFQKVC